MSTEPKWTFADFRRAAKKAGAAVKYDCVLVPNDGSEPSLRSSEIWPDRAGAEEWQGRAHGRTA